MSRQLLCEGFDPAFVPAVVFVRQGNKGCFLRGGADGLNESVDGLQLVESLDAMELVERQVNGHPVRMVKNGKWKVAGPYQRSESKNQNGRIYSRKIWEKLIADSNSPAQQKVKSRRMIGEIEHPVDGKGRLNRAALLTTKLQLREDGVVWGESEILNTPEGAILQALCADNVQWGISSRGSGTVRTDGEVDPDNYTLESFDAVLYPSTDGAYPKVVSSQSGTNESGEAASPAKPLDETDANTLRESADCLRVACQQFEESADQLALDAGAEQAASLLRRINAAAATDVLPRDEASDLSNRVVEIMRGLGLRESLVERVNETIDAAVESDDAERAIFRRIVESYQRRLRELYARLDEAESNPTDKVASRPDSDDRLVRTVRNFRAVVESRDALVADLQKRLDAAHRVIAEAQRQPDPVEEAVKAQLTVRPQLASALDRLRGCETPAMVHAMAEQLIAESAAPTTEAPPVELATPRGMVIESEPIIAEDYNPNALPAVPESARQAAAVVAALSAKR